MKCFLLITVTILLASSEVASGPLDLKNIKGGLLGGLGQLFNASNADSIINGLRDVAEGAKRTLKKLTKIGDQLRAEAPKDFDDFFDFIARFNKEYDDENSLKKRFGNFRNFLKRAKNEEDSDELHEAEYGITKYADLSQDEFEEQILTKIDPLYADGAESSGEEVPEDDDDEHRRSKRAIPSSLDWNAKGMDQGRCGSCYSFAAVAQVESVYKMKYGKFLSLSEQEIVSCTRNYSKTAQGYNKACNGGSSYLVIDYMKKYGLASTSANPYTSGDKGVVPACKRASPRLAYVSSFKTRSTNMTTFLESLQYHPILISMDARKLAAYKSGIMVPAKPSDGWVLTHVVLVTGYGTTSSGIKFWRIKNSFGKDWGENGYFRVKRDGSTLGITCTYTQRLEMK